jgi:hypothetical protein
MEEKLNGLYVSRSAFAKVQNENHRLKKILEVLCTAEPFEAIQMRIKYREMLAKDAEMWHIIKSLLRDANKAKPRADQAPSPLSRIGMEIKPRIHDVSSMERTPDLCCGMYPLPDNMPDVVECPHDHWECPYHACLSDHCQKAIVLAQGANLGGGMCKDKKTEE